MSASIKIVRSESFVFGMKQRVRKRLLMEAVAYRNGWLWTSGDECFNKLRGRVDVPTGWGLGAINQTLFFNEAYWKNFTIPDDELKFLGNFGA